MNAKKYLDLLLETIITPIWATVKNVKENTIASPDKPLLSLPHYKGLIFYASVHHIGKRISVVPYHDDPGYGYWRDIETGSHYHRSWLDFEDEGEPISLFPRDPKPEKIHWHSAGRSGGD